MDHHIQIVTDMLAGFQLGGGIQGVADHIAVGEVGHHEIVFTQSTHDLIRHGRQAQFRLLVKVDALGVEHPPQLLKGQHEVPEKSRRMLEQYKARAALDNPLDSEYMEDIELLYEDPEN